VVGLEDDQPAAGPDHAVDGPVGLEVVVGWGGGGVGGQEPAEVGHHRPAAVAVQPPDARRAALEAAGAATPGDQGVDRPAADLDVGGAEDVAEAVTADGSPPATVVRRPARSMREIRAVRALW
jgi:hypothetical protein